MQVQRNLLPCPPFCSPAPLATTQVDPGNSGLGPTPTPKGFISGPNPGGVAGEPTLQIESKFDPGNIFSPTLASPSPSPSPNPPLPECPPGTKLPPGFGNTVDDVGTKKLPYLYKQNLLLSP
jgi:hypothetical protein